MHHDSNNGECSFSLARTFRTVSSSSACRRHNIQNTRRCLTSHQTRSASTSTNPYPYPVHRHPTPHQIFHLPQSASQNHIKDRYYELVRVYHPDSPFNRTVSPATAQSRFQAISTAYDVLRGKARLTPSGDSEPIEKRTSFHEISKAMWKSKQRRRAEFEGTIIDERWKDRFIIGALFLTVAGFVAQTYSTRRQAMANALEGTERGYVVPQIRQRPVRTRSLDDAALSSEPTLSADPPEESSG